ncbi:MAG: DUF512 domain-containing protein [Oscillospiraceae bacterium]|nr:DUF512 domain-containing protein [Oscillospiraceae bacterium]
MESVITEIDRGSPADRTAIRPGDALLSINGHKILDVLDYKYYSYDRILTVSLRSPDGKEKSVKIKKREGEILGLNFETYLMDEPCACANSCLFCFVDQLPRGMRKTLYFKDDDARLSFLTGNYITLTNLSEREIQRICDLRISPINISVHATNPQLRIELLQNPRGDECLDIMRRFQKAGITMDCQIVCCPGINDGRELTRSMSDLSEMFPAVRSVSIVPVGLTKHRGGLPRLTPFSPEGASETVSLVEDFAEKCLNKLGSRIFFCADELYLKAGKDIPPDEYYEDYSQLENGVGMLRLFETEFMGALRACGEGYVSSGSPFSVATGVSAAPFISRLIEKAAGSIENVRGQAFAVLNDFFGHTINVAGLVTGRDLISQMKGRALGSRLLIPQTMLRHGEGVFLDDVTLADVENALGVPVTPVIQDGGAFLDAILEE